MDPLPIKRLHESLINRIAAGEVIHRPASALKELLENSLDAGSTSIRVTVKDGGLKLLQIQDNGSGIRKTDLPILAERFTTSKISSFSDLSSLTTYGFRGEALASMSHVAHLSVITKTKTDSCAWKAYYSDGKMVPAQQGQTEEPKPCAGNDGTTIMIENLFYNTPTRLAALKNPSEEYARILDVMTKYAIHNSKVAFMCKKSSSPTPSLSTPASSTTAQAIRLLYGHSIAKELIETSVRGKDKGSDDEPDGEDEDDWKATVHFTSANYQAKKMMFIFFINHRLVESPRLKKALEGVYTAVLPKGTSPFVYLSLLLPPQTVDVNVHPTKSAVHFLNEDAIIEKIADHVQIVLAESSSKSRGFDVGRQTLLTETIDQPEADKRASSSSSKKRKGKDRETDDEDEYEDEPSGSGEADKRLSTAAKPVYSYQKVRTSLKDRTLESMFQVSNPSTVGSPSVPARDKGKTREDAIGVDEQPPSATPAAASGTPSGQLKFKLKEIKESDCALTSVKTLRAAVGRRRHKNLNEILAQHIFVGIVDMEKSLSLVQFSTKLYLINHSTFAEEMFYQLGLRQFGDIPKIRLQPPPPIKRLLEIAIEMEDVAPGKLTKPQIVERIHDLLISRRDMLSEYFSLNISATGHVETIPMLLNGYTPNLEKLPCFLMRLGPQVNWTSETECFDSFLRELAYFNVPGALSSIEDQDQTDTHQQQEIQAERWQIQHVLFPAFRRYLIAPKSLLDGAGVLQIANLPDLYKVFERC